MISIGEFLEAFGFENMLLIATFIVSFVLLHFILDRVLKDKYGGPNPKVSGLIAFAISMLIVYGMHTLSFDLGEFLYNFGLEGEILETILTFAILGGIIFLVWKFGRKLFLLLGIVLTIIAGFTDWAHETEIVLFIGATMLFIWLLLSVFKKEKKKDKKDTWTFSPN